MIKNLFIFMLIISSYPSYSVPMRKVSLNNLYQHFFNVEDTKSCKRDINCKMLRRHIKRDSNACKSNPLIIENIENYLGNNRKYKYTSGHISYLGFFNARYRYFHKVNSDGDIIIRARVYFRGLKKLAKKLNPYAPQLEERRILRRMDKKLKDAAKIWQENNPYSYNIFFDFGVTTDKKQAQITPRITSKKTRGPYFLKWSIKWEKEIIAHEMGHVLGLDDEYKNGIMGASEKDCSLGSIMCNYNIGKPLEYHYYLILRRTLCNPLPSR